MKIDTVIDIASCKKTAVHTRLAHVLVGYKRMWGEETIEEIPEEIIENRINVNYMVELSTLPRKPNTS